MNSFPVNRKSDSHNGHLQRVTRTRNVGPSFRQMLSQQRLFLYVVSRLKNGVPVNCARIPFLPKAVSGNRTLQALPESAPVRLNFRIAQDYWPMSIVERRSTNAGHHFSIRSKLPYVGFAAPR